MTFFDFLFWFLCLVWVFMLSAVAREFRRGRRSNALKMLATVAILIVVYLTVIVATRLGTQLLVLSVGDVQMSGDWQLVVEGWAPQPQARYLGVEVNFRITNPGAKERRETGLIAYLLDDRGTRYDPLPELNLIPFDTPVQPGRRIRPRRVFHVPSNSTRLDLVVAHPGFRMDWFVIGRTPFDGRTIVHLQ